MARPKGSLNKRSHGVLSLLEQEFDLNPIRELAALCKREVPLVVGDQIVQDKDGNDVTIPFLKGNELVTALGKLADKTYATLKAQEIDHKLDNLPTVTVDMQGVAMDSVPAGSLKKLKKDELVAIAAVAGVVNPSRLTKAQLIKTIDDVRADHD